MTAAEGQPELAEEWTRVRRKGRRNAGPKTARLAPSTSPAAGATPTPSAPSLALADIEKDHEHFAGQWTSSPCHHQLQELITSRAADCVVTEAICFGVGSFDPADGAWEVRRRAHFQLAAFLCIVEQLQERGHRHIRCYFQEPLFNSVEKSFIESKGHRVVDSPQGFDMVSPSTLVFAIHMYRGIYSHIISKSLPAIFVGTPYDVWEDFHGSEQLDWARMKDLDQLCHKAKFPEQQGDTTFSSTSIHWRQNSEEQTLSSSVNHPLS
ncbi:hypothetical protein F5Y15DRAFT_229915 [Xylariaceae sp. FL0016]|nr:hypothetical protein F5Y15DRAFT_229915 [Xylariaceae sp. FL0016]